MLRFVCHLVKENFLFVATKQEIKEKKINLREEYIRIIYIFHVHLLHYLISCEEIFYKKDQIEFKFDKLRYHICVFNGERRKM